MALHLRERRCWVNQENEKVTETAKAMEDIERERKQGLLEFRVWGYVLLNIFPNIMFIVL